MKKALLPPKENRRLFSLICGLFIAIQSFAQKTPDWQLDRMPVKLETDYALSSLPRQLRAGATVYLLDPAKGYYVGRQGNNGFICFVTRTGWEWAEFRKDIITAISYDAEGAKTYFRVDQDVAAMRASGKYTALQVKNMVIDRIKKGIYKAPARSGISYMLEPVMRVYTGAADNNTVMTMQMPHYMFYAPYVTSKDIGNVPDGPFIGNPAAVFLGERKSPYGFMILPAGEQEKDKIISENKDLLKRLADYTPLFRTKS